MNGVMQGNLAGLCDRPWGRAGRGPAAVAARHQPGFGKGLDDRLHQRMLHHGGAAGVFGRLRLPAQRGVALLLRDGDDPAPATGILRSEEHTSELQSLMRISYAVFCLKKKKQKNKQTLMHYN